MPHNAVYGSVPSVLPSMDQVAPPEVSVQAIVEGSARAWLGRAENTRSTRSAENLKFQIGEDVDFFRQQNKKDISRWPGPAVVVDVSKASHGVITVRYQNQITEAMFKNERRRLHFWDGLC